MPTKAPPRTYTPAAPPRDERRTLGADLAIVTEQVGEFGGTERVLAEIVERYPLARVIGPRFGETNVDGDGEPSWMSRVEEVARGSRRRHHLAPVYARRVAATPLEPARVVLSLTHAGWSAAAAVPAGARHVCYSAGLPRALYDHVREYLLPYPAPVRPLVRATLPALRAYDRRLLRRPDRLLTNSRASAEALRSVHGRDPDVVYPPVRTSFFTPAPSARRHFLVVARLRPQKRVEVVVDAFRGLGESLVVAGNGPWHDRLRRRAPSNVTFAGYVPDGELRRLYRESHAVICPSVEDFGIVMAEAHACGTPVVAPRAGGALEIVSDGRTGFLIDRVDPGGVRDAVTRVANASFDPQALRASAERFSVERFVAGIEAAVEEERERALAAATL